MKKMDLGIEEDTQEVVKIFVSVGSMITRDHDPTQGLVIEMPGDYSPMNDDADGINPFPELRKAFVKAYIEQARPDVRRDFENPEFIRILGFSKMW